MTLDFFLNNYDLDEADIKKAIIKDKKLTLELVMVAHLDLIANGYRPEMDVDYDDTFVFDVEYEDFVFENPAIQNISLDNMTITINQKIVPFTSNIVNVK